MTERPKTQPNAGKFFSRGRYLGGQGRGDPPKPTVGTAGCGGTRRWVDVAGYRAPCNLGGGFRMAVGAHREPGARPPKGLPRRRRGRKSKTAMSRRDDRIQGSDVWKRGDLCNPPAKSDPAKKKAGLELLRAAKAAHLPCQVYEGKKKKIGLKTTMSFRCKNRYFVGPFRNSGGAPTLVQRAPARGRPPRRQE